VAAPVAAPVESPVAAPFAPRSDAPVAAPVESPVAAPVAAPVAMPPVSVPSSPPGKGCLPCDGGDVVFKFSPIEGNFETHLQLARLMGCELASIKSPEEQAAAVAAMSPFRNFPYSSQAPWFNAFVYIGGRLVESKTDISKGKYTFEWTDGSGEFTSQTNVNTMAPYTNFKDNDPNGGTAAVGFSAEPYLALSLDEGGSERIPRGLWIDYSRQISPALYKCCGPAKKDFSTCSVPGPKLPSQPLSFEF